ncbi:MAG: DNA primase small subunit domain-containing protein [Candidatus Hermodarchaeota archaeon]
MKNQKMKMSNISYLKKLFQAYYKEKRTEITSVNLFNKREFGFIPWDKQTIMKRHISFKDPDNLKKYLINEGPKHIYSSGSIYLQPDNPDMSNKEYQGCDLIFDIDVDHFYTPCKNEHDLWNCVDCGESGTGMVKKCPSCKSLKLKSLTWICEDCLGIAKNQLMKLIYKFLIPDFGISLEQMKIAFSGHRGYHLKIENEDVRTLTGEERREIASYVSGSNISLEILGLRQFNNVIYGLLENNIGWSQKIMNQIIELLQKYPDDKIRSILTKFGLKTDTIKSFLNSKDDFLQSISQNNYNVWNVEGFGIKNWSLFLNGIISEIGAKIDEPVTIDIHRLIRYPGSLHGKTGFKVQELFPDDLDNFHPLDEGNALLDPIVFQSEKEVSQKLEIIENLVPITKIKGETYGPYKKGQKIEVPHHFAVFLLCKEVAKTI